MCWMNSNLAFLAFSVEIDPISVQQWVKKCVGRIRCNFNQNLERKESAASICKKSSIAGSVAKDVDAYSLHKRGM